MYKLIFLVLIMGIVGLYFSGALDFDTGGDSVDITIDKDKAQEFGESIQEHIEE
jgi:hypothetical protein